MGNTDPTNQSGEPRNPGSHKSKQFLFLIRYMQCDSYSYYVLESTMRKQTKKHIVSYETLTTLRMILFNEMRGIDPVIVA